MFKRIGLLVLANLAVFIMLSVILTVVQMVFGVNFGTMAGSSLNLSALFIFSMVVGFSGSIISLLMSKQMAKMSMGVQMIDTNNPQPGLEAYLVGVVRHEAERAGIPMPEVGIYEGEPNAFATGASASSAMVAVSTGLLNIMNRDEVEAVLAHEISHVKNGVYGAMFCAAMISAAFCERDAERIVEAGLAQIPRNCRLTQDVRQAMAIARSSATAEELLDRLWQAFEHYDPVHTNNNAALCAAVLLFAGDDYEKGITTAVLGGWDTDCNGATVGSILGAKLGAQAIPAHWTEPLHDTLYSAIPGFHPIAIRECARRSKALSDRYLLTGKGE